MLLMSNRQLSIVLKEVIGLVCIVLGMIVPFSLAKGSPSTDSVLFPSDSSPYGIPYKEWLGKWWQYWLGIPDSKHPALDYTPDKCQINQDGPVWFLPDVVLIGDATSAAETFSCSIPAGKAIFIPVSTGSCWLGLTSGIEQIPDKLSSSNHADNVLNECAIPTQNATKILYANVDGLSIVNEVRDSHATTSYYNVTISPEPAVRLFDGIGTGTSRAIADGYSIFLQPLEEGSHVIDFKVSDIIGGQTTDRTGRYDILIQDTGAE